MECQPFLLSALSAAFIGVLSHLAVFVRSEWDNSGPKLFYFMISAPWIIAGTSHFYLRTSVAASIIYGILIPFSWTLGVFSSITIYRLFFHRTRKFPGPLGNKISAFYTFYTCVLPGYQRFIKYQEFHDKYGDFVRVSPREISINSPEAVAVIHGPRSKCSKGTFYDGSYPDHSLHTTRDKAYHNKRRRTWDRGFSTKALQDYDHRIMAHAHGLHAKILKYAEEGVRFDATKLLAYFSMDVMADLTFGKSFRLVETGEENDVWEYMHKVFGPAVALNTALPWLIATLKSLPITSIPLTRWLEICWRLVQERLQMKKDKPDLFSHLLDTETATFGKKGGLSVSERDLRMDSELAIIAGTDTTATTLASTMYLLTMHPDKLAKLREEIDECFTSIDDFNYENVARKPYLEAVINEALRLYPPVPSGLQRLTPPEGITVDGTHIPGDTLVNTPTMAIHRDSRNFLAPSEFIPERWTDRPEMIHNKNAFFPFGIGVYGCAGKPLAYKELRSVISILVRCFDWDLVNRGATVKAWSVDDPGCKVKECFTMAPPSCEMIFTVRKTKD